MGPTQLVRKQSAPGKVAAASTSDNGKLRAGVRQAPHTYKHADLGRKTGIRAASRANADGISGVSPDG
jgi:hypothetical protein